LPEQDTQVTTELSATEVPGARPVEEVAMKGEAEGQQPTEPTVTDETLVKDAVDIVQLNIGVKISSGEDLPAEIPQGRLVVSPEVEVPTVVLEEERRVREILEFETSLSKARGAGNIGKTEELLHVGSPFAEAVETQKLASSQVTDWQESAVGALPSPPVDTAQTESDQGEPILDAAEFNKGPMADWETELQQLRDSRLHEASHPDSERGKEGKKPEQEGPKHFIIVTRKPGDTDWAPPIELPGGQGPAPSTSYDSGAPQLDPLIIVYERDVLGLTTAGYEVTMKSEREIKLRAPDQEPRTFLRSDESPGSGQSPTPELGFHHAERKRLSNWDDRKVRNRSQSLPEEREEAEEGRAEKPAEETELLADETAGEMSFLPKSASVEESWHLDEIKEPEIALVEKFVEPEKLAEKPEEKDADKVGRMADILILDMEKEAGERDLRALEEPKEREMLQDLRESEPPAIEDYISPASVERSKLATPVKQKVPEVMEVVKRESLPVAAEEPRGLLETPFDWDMGPSRESLPTRPSTRTADTQTEMSTDLFRAKDVREASTYAFLSEDAEEGRRAPDDYLPLYLHRVTLNDKPSIAEMIRKLAPCSDEWEEAVPMNWKINPAKHLEKWPSPCVQDVHTPTLLLLGGINLSALGEVLTGCLILRYNLEENEWRRCNMMPLPRYGHRCVYMSGEIYIIGGFDNRDATYGLRMSTSFCFRFNTHTGELLSSVERYSHDEDKWVVLEKGLYCGRMGMGVAAFQNMLWVVGGIVQIAGLQTCSTAYVEIYNPAVDQ
ncbi:unnamed protein product, partial [Ixodes hexagonus]